jgi:tetratricopeptide (TPR) repeat protein
MSKESYSKGRVSSLKSGRNKMFILRSVSFKVFLCVTLVLLIFSGSGRSQEGKKDAPDTNKNGGAQEALKRFFDKKEQNRKTEELSKDSVASTFFNTGSSQEGKRDSSETSKCEEARELLKKGYESNDLNVKINHYEQAKKLCPNVAVIHYSLGVVYEKSNRIGDAINEYKTALKLDPQNAKAHFNIAAVYASVREYDLAIKHYQEFMTITDGNDKYAEQYSQAQQRIEELKAEKVAYEQGKQAYNKDAQEYLAKLSVAEVEPEKKEKRGVKELKLLSMTTASLLDYYGTAKDDRNCETLGKSLKLLNQLLFQEQSQENAGRTDPRFVATIELLSALMPKNQLVKGIKAGTLPSYTNTRTLPEIQKDINRYSSQGASLPEGSEGDPGEFDQPIEGGAKGGVRDISGTYECIGANCQKSGTYPLSFMHGTQTISPSMITQDGSSIILQHRSVSETSPWSETTLDTVLPEIGRFAIKTSQTGWSSTQETVCRGTITGDQILFDCETISISTPFSTTCTYIYPTLPTRTETEDTPANRQVFNNKNQATILSNGDLQFKEGAVLRRIK